VGGIVAAARNVISGNTGDGVEIRGALASGNRVQGNFLGTNAAGTLSLGNGNVGVRINGAPNNTVGGTVAGARNVLSGNNDSGVVIEGAVAGGNLVQGNFIGVNPAGTADMGNAFDGVQIRGAAVNNTVGGTVAAARNIISGNNQFGVFVRNADTVSNRIQGNFIGLAANGVAPMGNTSHGIWIADAANNNTIGGAAAGAGNVIAHNGGDGVLIGNDPAFLGLTTAGSENSVLGNRIFSNAGQGIDLGNNDGPTPNDVNDADSGPNDLLNNPVLTSAFLDGANLQITGFINTNQFRVLRIEFFASPVSGQGQTFLGFHTVNVGQNNSIAFAKMLVVPPSVLVGHKLTATITDQFGSTSEFSLPVTIE
jgi:parallel beta-helix repeat protein